MIAAWVVAGALSLAWNAVSFAAVAEIAGYVRSGAAIGLHQTVLGIGSFSAPIAFGAIVSATSWRIGLATFALCPLAAYAVYAALQRTPQPDPERT